MHWLTRLSVTAVGFALFLPDIVLVGAIAALVSLVGLRHYLRRRQ
jgi:hypothetical protein